MTAPSDTDTQRKLSELSFLREIAQLTSSTRDWDEMLRIVIDRTTDAMRAEVSSLYLVEKRDGLLRLVASNGLNPRAIGKATLRIGEGITGWVANARIPLTVRDVHAEPRWKIVPSVDVDRFTSMLSVPLVIRDEVIGVMNVQTVELREFERGEIDFLQTIANQVAGIIEKSRLQRDAERKLREVSALFEVSNVLTSTLELDEVLGLVVDRLVRVYPGASGGILLRDEGGDAVLRASSGSLPRSALLAARTALAETRPVVAPDSLALPLIAGDRLVGALANQAALAIDKASLYALERRTAESLRELDRARSDFVAVVTHDLRTPLSVVRGYLDLFAEKSKNGHRLPLAEATAQVERLDQLVDRILASVKEDRPDISVRRTRFDLRAGLVSAVREMGPMARKHTLRGPRAGAPLWARGDKRRTAEVVAGLVHNATKYAPAATAITVSVSKEADRAVVRVTDEGPGVRDEDRRRIFEPFVRLGSDEISGAGIGLFSCRRVAEAQGGALWYEDRPHGARGSVFAFSVPLARGDDR